jgi:hypothetical protein
VKEVPVNWACAAAAAVGDDYREDFLEEGHEGGGLFGFKIGTMEVDDEPTPLRPGWKQVGDDGKVPEAYLSEQALGQLSDAGHSGVQKAVHWNDGGSAGGQYPVTGAQRRTLIAQREHELQKQRMRELELAALQRQQAQARFAEYTGPPCGVGMALQAATRMLMGTLRNHKRWVIEVDSLLPDGPAARSGQILPGDVLLSVREASDKVGISVNNRVEEAKALIMGPPGSVVILRFTRGDTLHEHTHASFEVPIVREAVKHPSLPLPDFGASGDEEVDWALLPEQATVEPGDTPLSLEGMPLAALSNEELQALLTGEEGKSVEMIVRKKDGSQARVAVYKKPLPRPAQQLKLMLHGPEKEKHAPDQRFMGSRTLAKLASTLPALPTPPIGGAVLGAAARPSNTSEAAAADSSGGWLSKVGSKVSGLFGRVSAAPDPTTPAGNADKLSPAKGSLSGRVPVADGGEEWVVLTNPDQFGGGSTGEEEKEASSWEASTSAQEIRMMLESKRLPVDVLLPRLKMELGVQTCEDMGYLTSADITRLNLPVVMARKLMELVSEETGKTQSSGSRHSANSKHPAYQAALPEENKENKQVSHQQTAQSQLHAQQAQQLHASYTPLARPLPYTPLTRLLNRCRISRRRSRNCELSRRNSSSKCAKRKSACANKSSRSSKCRFKKRPTSLNLNTTQPT